MGDVSEDQPTESSAGSPLGQFVAQFHRAVLPLIVFVSGAVVMVFELAGSRVVGPYFGTSLFVWTSLIGIILGSLSIGYYVGGRLADRVPSYERLSFILLLAAAGVTGALIFKDILLTMLQSAEVDVRTSVVLAAIILFSPASILLGMVSPYAVKLSLRELAHSGRTVGNLYALSTVGSIVGTFLAGFYLIPHFGTNRLLAILVCVLIACATVLFISRHMAAKVGILVLAMIFASQDGFLTISSESDFFVDVDN